MSVLKPISPFRKWVYHTLPLVYDDSLSYMELLGKIIKYCNELRDSGEHISEELQGAIASIRDLQEYVDSRFDEKMVEAIDSYFAEHDLVQSVNGQSGVVNIESLKNPNKIYIAVHDPAIHSEGEASNYEYDGENEVTVPIDLPVIPAPPVASVNGQTGAVVISSLPNEYGLVISYGGVQQAVYNGSEGKHVNIPAPVYPVTSVNGKTGAVVVTLSELNGLANVANSVNGNVLILKSVDVSKLKGAVSDSGKVLSIADDGSIHAVTIGAASETVMSVNGLLGAVVLTAKTVGAIPDEDGAVKLTHLANAGTDNIGKGLVVNEDGTIGYGGIGAVTRVNGKTGDVQLNAGDVSALSNQAGSVGSNNIAPGAVTSIHIADNSIGREKLNFSLSAGSMQEFSGTTVFEGYSSFQWQPVAIFEAGSAPALLSLDISLLSSWEGAAYVARIRHRVKVDTEVELYGRYIHMTQGGTNNQIGGTTFNTTVDANDAIYIELKPRVVSSSYNRITATCYVKAIRH